MKVPAEINKRSSSRLATINIKVKLDTPSTKRKEYFIQKGLLAVITIKGEHNHSLTTAEALNFLPTEDCKENFFEYFNDGMGVAESCKYNDGALQLHDKITEVHMANSSINLPTRAVQYWYDEWRLQNLGPRTGNGVIEKLKEKLDLYEEKGITIRFSEDPFALVIMTPIIKRAHNLNTRFGDE